jgi:hypothetical protein
VRENQFLFHFYHSPLSTHNDMAFETEFAIPFDDKFNHNQPNNTEGTNTVPQGALYDSIAESIVYSESNGVKSCHFTVRRDTPFYCGLFATFCSNWLPYGGVYLTLFGMWCFWPDYSIGWMLFMISTSVCIANPTSLRVFLSNWMIRGVAYWHPLSCTVEHMLPPSQQRILAVHPHGISLHSAQLTAALAQEPNVPTFTPRETECAVATLVFFWPGGCFSRASYRVVRAKMHSLRQSLRSMYNLMILPGGALESAAACSEREEVLVRDRFGLAKLALEADVPIIPVYVFGDLLMWDSYPRWLWRFFRTLFALLRIPLGSPIIPLGRFGLPLPRDVPIHVVYGPPVTLPEGNYETMDDKVQTLAVVYEKAVCDLYKRHATDSMYKDRPLHFVLEHNPHGQSTSISLPKEANRLSMPH